MEVFDAIRTRRSIRKYKDKQVPWDNIVTIMQAGKYAPSRLIQKEGFQTQITQS